MTFFTTVAKIQANNRIKPAFKMFNTAPVKPEYIDTNGVAIEFKFKMLKNKTNASIKTTKNTTLLIIFSTVHFSFLLPNRSFTRALRNNL